MNRRNFMASCGAVTGAAAFFESMAAIGAVPGDKPFAKAKLRMSAPIDWFPGKSPAEKVKAAAEWGLPAYEWLGANDVEGLRAAADACGLELSCMGGAGRIGPGTMVKKEDHDDVVAKFKERVALAKKLNCRHLVGLSGNTRDDVSVQEQTDNVIACLKRLAPIAEENKVLLVMEARNPLVDHKGSFLTRTDQEMAILK
ncbi:MAG: TIM barrel protein, partial [Candidatus Hydrogenedentes bacterium]|nr:TIM barrel protein [Candidatus Hydrogenedentota bacterium]